jgi:hypothetical protein
MWSVVLSHGAGGRPAMLASSESSLFVGCGMMPGSTRGGFSKISVLVSGYYIIRGVVSHTLCAPAKKGKSVHVLEC